MTWTLHDLRADFPEIVENQLAYNHMKQDLESKHWGHVLLMHDKQIAGFYDTRGDAYTIGCGKFGWGHFIVKSVGEKPISLGMQGLFQLGAEGGPPGVKTPGSPASGD